MTGAISRSDVAVVVHSFDKGTPVARPVRKARDLVRERDRPVAEKAFADAWSATRLSWEFPMKRTIPLLLALAFLASCDDEQKAKSAAVPTAPAVSPVAAQATTAAATVTGGSTICRVYVTERDVAKTQLDAAPTDSVKQRRVSMLDALVKETCN